MSWTCTTSAPIRSDGTARSRRWQSLLLLMVCSVQPTPARPLARTSPPRPRRPQPPRPHPPARSTLGRFAPFVTSTRSRRSASACTFVNARGSPRTYFAAIASARRRMAAGTAGMTRFPSMGLPNCRRLTRTRTRSSGTGMALAATCATKPVTIDAFDTSSFHGVAAYRPQADPNSHTVVRHRSDACRRYSMRLVPRIL
jgi:hypothetical protein